VALGHRPGPLGRLSARLRLGDKARQPVEVLGGAADLALAHQFDQAGFRQLGDVIVGVA
jgi:hypothetical protein